MSKHTSGPWRVVNGVQVCTAAGQQIAKIWMMRNGEGKRNANLIAASPDLLAALTVIVDNGGIGPESMFHDARDAIAKATGAKL